MCGVERLATAKLIAMDKPHLIPSNPAPQPEGALPALEPVDWMDTVPMAYGPQDESEVSDA